MKRFTTLAAAFLLLFSSARADEGMWLLHMLQRINEASMQEAGLRLSAQDIYDINNASLKDAIVRLNGGKLHGGGHLVAGLGAHQPPLCVWRHSELQHA